MLDQNTDRMWYVIGAVIIGAAIIFIMNNTFPQLFASIGETFENKTDEVTEITDGIYPVGYKGVNILGNTSDNWVTIGVSNGTGITFPTEFISLDDYGLSAGDTVTYSGTYDAGENTIMPRLMFTVDAIELNDETEINHISDVKYNGKGSFKYTTTIPETAHYVKARFGHMGGAKGTYLDVKHMKIEKGSVATPY